MNTVSAIIFPLQEKTRWDLQERLLNHFRDSFNDKIGKFPYIFYELQSYNVTYDSE